MITIRLGYDKPPLKSNEKSLHWAERGRRVKAIRKATAIWGWDQATRRGNLPGFPIDYPITVTGVWEVTDRRVRDAGAIAPTIKAAIDGLVDGGVLACDSHDIVTEERYRVEVGPKHGIRIEIERVQ